LILAKEEKLEVLDDISAKKLEHFLIADHGTSIYTTTKRVKHFKAFCKYVELQGWCRFDWLSRISASDKKASRKRALHQDEVQMLLKYLKANHLDVWYPIIFTMLNTGLRSKEIIFLEWDDIDLKGMTLRVRPKPHIVVNGEPVLCKSESSVRAVPLSSRALAVLKTLSSRSGYVFPSASGMHRANNFYRDFMVALKDAPLSRIKEVTPHVMRHTFISHLLVYGKQDLLTVSRLAGHASIETTQIYLHLIGGDEHRRGAVESLPDYEV
jgi:integrase